MDLVDKKILDDLQKNFPVDTRPFLRIGERAGILETEVLERIANLKSEGIIRQISPIFDSSKIGYHSSLCAFKVEGGCVNTVADLLNTHPGISHNYLRNGVYNIWFTLTMLQSVDLQSELEKLARQAAITQWLFLPTIKTFKIGFTLDMNGHNPPVHKDIYHRAETATAPVNKEFVRALQGDLPLVSRPFEQAAVELGISEQEIIEMMQEYINNGRIRRVAAVLRPLNAGFLSNILVVWATSSDEHTKQLGKYAASLNQVSHCYQRPCSKLWPYSVYTMIHGCNTDDCKKVIWDISSATNTNNYSELETKEEFKKVRVTYF